MFWNYIEKGGVIMLPLLALSVLSLAVAIEKAFEILWFKTIASGSTKERVEEILESRLRYLNFVYILAPQLGILGTILGLMKACLGKSELNFSAFQKGFAESLTTTFSGLTIAIVAAVVKFWVEGKILRR